MVTMSDRLSQLYALERQGIVTDVTLTAPGDGGRRFSFVVVADKRERLLRSGELDPFLQGVEVGLAVPRPDEPQPQPTGKAAAK